MSNMSHTIFTCFDACLSHYKSKAEEDRHISKSLSVVVHATEEDNCIVVKTSGFTYPHFG